MEVSGVRRREHFQTTSPLKPLGRFLSYFTYSIYVGGTNKLCFCFGRIRTPVAMTTHSSHDRLIMGKAENDSFCCLVGDI